MSNSIKDKLDTFFSEFPQHNFSKNEIIIPGGATPLGVYYLVQGQVRQYSTSPQGQESTLNIFKPQAFFPLIWALNNTPNHTTFQAMSVVHTRRAPRDEVLKFIKSDPEVLFDITQRLLSGLDGMLRKVEHLMSSDSEKRLIFGLVNLCYRFGSKDPTQTTINIPLTHQEIANMVGMARETVSRELKKLEHAGLITIADKRITITDIERLKTQYGENNGT